MIVVSVLGISVNSHLAHTHTHMQIFSGHFPAKFGDCWCSLA